MSPDAPLPAVLCRPYLIDFPSIGDRLRAYGNDVRAAVEDLSVEPLPTYERLAQQQFLECLDAMSWRDRPEAHSAARALFDRLFWTWRGEDLRIVEVEPVPFALDTAWSPTTVALFAELWGQLSRVFGDLREPFDRAASEGELVGRFQDFVEYAKAWGGVLERASDEGQALIVVQFDTTS